jgi:protein-L-isoaspartate(D-aspartate) O-methyltransferase
MNGGGSSGNRTPDRYREARHQMVETQIRKRQVSDIRVLDCLEQVPRHEFVPAEFSERAYEDVPLPIGGGQTISQPYIVAAMTQAHR